MRRKVKVAVAAGIVAALTSASAALGQTGETPRRERTGERHRPKVCRSGEHRGGFGGRLVHSEAKVQVEGGFALIVVDRGAITAVDAESGSVTIRRADDETVKVTAGERTRVCRNAKATTLSELRTGDRAAILQTVSEGKRLVRAIRAHSSDAAGQPEGSRARRSARRPAAAEVPF